MENSAHHTLHRPMIAILTMDDPAEMFRGNKNNFVDIVRTGAEMGVSVCVVTVKNLKLRNKKIIGYTYDPATKQWSQQLFGLPHIIYNRIPQRQDESLPEVQQTLKACIRHPQIRLFNPSFFNKWSLFEWLNKAKTTSKYLPATRKLSGSQELESFIKIHPVAYLKPIRGKAGKGIMKVERLYVKGERRTEYWLTMQETKGSRVYKFPTISQMWEKIKEEIGQEEYIAQKGVTLAKHRNRPFDLRALVQKNYKGEWGVTGIGARLAGKTSITTHVPRGGSIDDPEKLLASTFGPVRARRMLFRAKKAALAIARQIEKKSGHTLGEMSMDLGVDTKGNIWFFEANSKPMKFDEPHIRKKSLERLIHYSLYLIRTKHTKTGGVNVANPN